MDVLKQVRNDFFGEDYKKYILTGFQKYFENKIPMSDEKLEEFNKWLDEESYGLTMLRLGNLNENGKKHGWFKYYLNKKFKGRGYAINGEIFFHFVVPEDDGSVEYYAE